MPFADVVDLSNRPLPKPNFGRNPCDDDAALLERRREAAVGAVKLDPTLDLLLVTTGFFCTLDLFTDWREDLSSAIKSNPSSSENSSNVSAIESGFFSPLRENLLINLLSLLGLATLVDFKLSGGPRLRASGGSDIVEARCRLDLVSGPFWRLLSETDIAMLFNKSGSEVLRTRPILE